MKLHFGQHHTFQHCSDTFKLKKRATFLNLANTINQHGWNLGSSLLTYATAYKLIALLLRFVAITPFPKLLRCEIDIVVSYCIVPYLQRWLVTSSAVHNYWKCYINIVTQMCLGFYWYIHTLPRVLRALGSHTFISVNPLLPCCNILINFKCCI